MGTGYHGNTADRGCFFYSSDRGQHWEGPFPFEGLADEENLKGKELTPRTDNLIQINEAGLLFLSARAPGNWADEKVFCVRTIDGGQTFQFVAWVVDPADPYRAVMPNTVQDPSFGLISAVRRREMGTNHCWLDAYGSMDAGRSWTFHGKIAETGLANGNPPALVQLSDGRLCCAYGNRASQQIEARYSPDQGRSWSDPLVLRADFQADSFGDADLGYVRLVQRHDGRLVAVYYWANADHPQQHIAATIWKPVD
jgi:hypothetical protein